MASSAIKHRLRPSNGAPIHKGIDPNSGDSRMTPPPRHPRRAHSTRNPVILCALGLVLTVAVGTVLFSPSSRRSSERTPVQSTNDVAGGVETAKINAVTVTKAGGLRTKSAAPSKPQPYSTLLATLEKQKSAYGETPLTGFYTLGKDFALSNDATEGTSGWIQFPHADLADVLSEEATHPLWRGQQAMRLTVGVSGRQVVNKQAGPLDTSFLGDAPDPFTKSVFVHGGKASGDQALLTRCGYKMGKLPNQDRSFVASLHVDGISGAAKEGQTRQSALLMGIFDGHGARGHEVSHFAALHLPEVFAGITRQQSTNARPFASDDDVRRALIEAFLKVDENEPVKGTGGSTASVLLYPGSGSKAYIANAGDSTTLIVGHSKSKGFSTIAFQNKNHKPHMAGERQRIEKAGGKVMIPPSLMQGGNDSRLQESSRIIIPDPSGNFFGGLALAMSRSIGDFDGKQVGLTAEPDIDVWDLHAQQYTPDQKEDTEWFAIVASDGIYDMIAPEVVAQYLGQSLYRAKPSAGVSPLEACERLIRESSRLWLKASMGQAYRDDISIGVAKINFVGA